MADTGPSEPQKPRSRMEDEVLEILQRTDQPPSNVIKFQSRVQRERRQASAKASTWSTRMQVTPGTALVASLILAIAAALVVDSSTLLARLLAYVSALAFVAVFVMWYRRPRGGGSVKRWRGRDIDFSPPPSRPAWMDRFFPPKGPRR